MPVIDSKPTSVIEESLRKSLHPHNNFDQLMVSGSKKVLLQNIDFERAKEQHSFIQENLRAKYTPLNPSQPGKEINGHAESSENDVNGDMDGGEALPSPRVVLYPEDKIKLGWQKVTNVGGGLLNMGNTCFLNSTLQCLTYIPPLANYLLHSGHGASCKLTSFCMVCALEKHVKHSFESSCTAFKPLNILHKLKMIAKHMQWGKQEDAHEFLRHLVDAMQKSCLNGYNKLDSYSKETTVVNGIFGGYLRSQVTCSHCKARSNTYDPIMDICLDIKNVSTLEKAFERFVQAEKLDGENSYNCTKCNAKVPAQKRFTIHKPPKTLCIQFKRFDYQRHFGKITKHLAFPPTLNLRPYMSCQKGERVMYDVCAVNVHQGHSCNSGHYFSYCQAPNKTWNCMNDSQVHQTSMQKVLNAEAYMLFYTLREPSPFLKKPESFLESTKKSTKLSNGPPGISMNKIDSLPMRKTIDQPSKPIPTPIKTSKPVTSPASTLTSLSNREKISFAIKPKENPKTDDPEKPRIVMRLKNGQVEYNSVYDFLDKRSLDFKDGISTPRVTRLVPYNSGSDSGSDQEIPSTSGLNSSKPPETMDSFDTNKRSSNAETVPFMDERLNCTTMVPGAYGPLYKPEVLSSPSKRTDKFPVGAIPHPVRKSLSDTGSLSVQTNTENVKVNSTTKWNILGQDAQVSPSVTSASSNGSLNSTTDWQVCEGTNRVKNAVSQQNGWTISLNPNTSSASQGSATSPTKGQSQHQQHPRKQLYITLKKTSSPDSNGSSSSNQEYMVKNNSSAAAASLTSQPHPASCTASHSQSQQDHINWQNTHFKSSTEPYTLPGKLENGLPHASSKVPLINGVLDDLTEKHEKRKSKKHKKHKHRKHDEERMCNGMEDQSCFPFKKSKKKKHKKRRHDDEEPLLDESPGGPSKKCKSEGSSDEYEWVEKTMETIVEKKVQPNASVAKPPVISQFWDHHVQDGYKRPHSETQTKLSIQLKVEPVWDGARTSQQKVVDELQKMSSSHGYGSSVTSWDGGASLVNDDSDRDRKRKWTDDYEEELDMGKTKKKPHLPNTVFGTHTNPFQTVQDNKNAEKEMRRSGMFSPDRDMDQERGPIRSHDRPSCHGYHPYRHQSHHPSQHRDAIYRDGHSHHSTVKQIHHAKH